MENKNSLNDPTLDNDDVLGENMKLLIMHREFNELAEDKKEKEIEEGKR